MELLRGEEMETRPITIREAAKMMKANEEFVRQSIRDEKIPGAYYIKQDGKGRGTFYITNAQVVRMMEGRIYEGNFVMPCGNGNLSGDNRNSDQGHN